MKTRTKIIAAAVFGLASVTGTVVAAPAAIQFVRVDGQAERVELFVEGPIFPIESEPLCQIVNGFGGHSNAFGPGGHQGIDIGAAAGQEVYAVESGVLSERWDNTGAAGFGWQLTTADDIKYRYFHLASLAEGLKMGDAVEKGQVIGTVGKTGNTSGVHLHFEMRPGPSYQPVDPYPTFAPFPKECVDYYH